MIIDGTKSKEEVLSTAKKCIEGHKQIMQQALQNKDLLHEHMISQLPK